MRTRELFCDKWKFHRGDVKIERPKDKMPIYFQSKTERYKVGPAAVNYDDSASSSEEWSYVRLPHDYVIEGAPSKDENCALGYLKYDNAWYRKEFFISKEDDGKRILLEFEGCAGQSTVYLNGCLLKRNFCGYTSFEVDVTDFVNYGSENLLAVYLNLDEFEGWWYEGGGIYRNVWLTKTDSLSVDTYGVYVNPIKLDSSNWRAEFETTLVNVSSSSETAILKTEIIDKDGKTVSVATASLTVEPHAKATALYSASLTSPHLWDVDDPYLYTIKTSVIRKNTVCDEYFTRTGFRYFSCDSQKGFILNGKQVKIKGVCAHEDCGLLGKAVPENVHRYKIQLLKEMGANGYRTSHYQQNAAILDTLDELGFIVLAEARWFSSSEESIAQLEALVKRDRNRPSVFFWSLGNEEFYHVTEQGKKITQTLYATLRRLDKSRPITSAIDKTPDKATVIDELDIIGINYNLDIYDEIRAKYPQKAVFSSENCANGTSRSCYSSDASSAYYLPSFDNDTGSWFRGREHTWKFIAERDWIMGGYQWAGFEHRGEATWPRLCSQSGAIDLFLQKKDAFYQNKSHWHSEPCIHLLPYWNLDLPKGETVCVWCYTNCEEAELFLNGKSMGRKTVAKNTHLEWEIPYEEGRLEAVGYNKKKVCATDIKETAGKPNKLMLRLENEFSSVNDVAIISCYTVDSEGKTVPNAAPTVSFYTNTLGRIIATGSDICDHTPLCANTRKMREGYISLAVGIAIDDGIPVATDGSIEIFASADGLKSAKLVINFSDSSQ